MNVLFYIAKKYSIPIIKPIVLYLQKADHSYAFYVSAEVETHFPEDWDKNDILRTIRQTRNFHPDVVLCPGNFVDFRIPGIKVQIFHGLGVEKAAHFKIRHFFDVYATSGPWVTQKFKQLEKMHQYFLVIETGWPKVDHIVNFPQDNLLQRYNLPLDKKIILYAPTFSSKMQSAESLLDTIPEIMQPDEFWIIKFHELMDSDTITLFKEKLSQQSLFIDDYDITPYLHAADLLVSDTSSVIYEFMILDKPVITYRTISRKDKGINITSPDQLKDAIATCKTNPMHDSSTRKRHVQEINPYIDGSISERLIRKLADIKENKVLNPKKKPLNLFRKSQVIYHSMFRKGYLR